jgi:5-formyltetrahydrofolate cyclo-ligase
VTRSADPATAKADLRAQVRAGRQALTDEQIERSRAGVRAHVLARMDSDAAVGRPWRRVFAYEPLPDEPASVRLLEAMADRGASIYVPWVRPDRDLDWMRWPDSTTLGRGAVADATVVLVPAFAVDRSGMRLGRGGGSYDRALTRLSPDTQVIAMLHPGELLTFVPTEPWDLPVSAVVTAQGWFDVPPPTRPTTART